LTNFSTFTKVARAKIIQALISSPMRCHLVGSGTVNRTQATTQGFTARTRLSAKVTTGPKLIEIVRNPHAEGQFNHVKGLKRD